MTEEINIVTTICEQLKAGGLQIHYFTLVKLDDKSLKISKGYRGAIITYNAAADVYEVQGYKWPTEKSKTIGLRYTEKFTDIYANELPATVADVLNTELIKL